MRAAMMKDVERFKGEKKIRANEEGSQKLDRFLRTGISDDLRKGLSKILDEVENS